MFDSGRVKVSDSNDRQATPNFFSKKALAAWTFRLLAVTLSPHVQLKHGGPWSLSETVHPKVS